MTEFSIWLLREHQESKAERAETVFQNLSCQEPFKKLTKVTKNYLV